MKTSYLEVAERIGARLCRDALWSRGRCNWTADRAEGRTTVHASLGPLLYDGTAGIALCLWRLAEVTGERIFRLTAEAALRHALSKLPAGGPGLYAGAPGILFAAWQMGRQIEETQALEATALRPEMLDLIGGSAGAIIALLCLYSAGGDARLLETAVSHGELLLAHATRAEEGWSWKTIRAVRNCTGISHGTAGIAWALLELWQVTRQDRFRAAALEAFRYERSCFDPHRQAWPDFREELTQYPVLWCHGAVGIGFSRLRAWQILQDDQCLAEARIALAKTIDTALAPANYSLCHGKLGNADFLIQASQVLGEETWLAPAEQVAQEAMDLFERRRLPWPCGLPNANETPDLMLGLAGIAYFYLRLADPSRISTVLLPHV
ncbi:MAG: lanthionine synthetase LanC family protein [Bryobacteraceae bacterium]